MKFAICVLQLAMLGVFVVNNEPSTMHQSGTIVVAFFATAAMALWELLEITS